MAFDTALPGIGAHVVGVGLALFAFTTVLGWSIYGERCASFLLGERAIIPFRILWTLAVPLGAVADLEFIWLLADTLNALMALPNLVALLLLSPVVVSLTREYFSEQNT
jgi:AGCS family alanine or glycine:cation symporter